MDYRVRHQLPDRQQRIRALLGPKNPRDLLTPRKLIVQVFDQFLETGGVAPRTGLLLNGLDAALAPVENHPHGLTSQPLEVPEPLGEQDGTEIRDLPVSAGAGSGDQSLPAQAVKQACLGIGEWLLGHLEEGGMVEEGQGLVRGQICSGNLILERRTGTMGPQQPFLLGVFLQSFLVGPHPDVFHSTESHWAVRGRLDAQDDDRMVVIKKLLKLEVNPWLELGGQPVLQLLVAHLRSLRAEGGAQQAERPIFYPPNNVAAFLVVKCGTIGDGGNLFSNLLRLVPVVLELDPLNFVPKRKQ